MDRPKKDYDLNEVEAKTGNIVIKVADTGPGISKEIRSRIFEPFFTTKEIGKGTGIGLSFCDRIVQSHGGTIKLETTEGFGSIFTVSLPSSDRQETYEEVAAVAPAKPAGRTCLVVDDEKEVGDLIAEVLAQEGFKVTVARSGEEALLQLSKHSYSLILSDLKMPNIDGRTMFKHISDFHPEEVERLAFLTGDTVSPDAQVFLHATKRPFLEKPVKPNDLRAFVSRFLN